LLPSSIQRNVFNCGRAAQCALLLLIFHSSLVNAAAWVGRTIPEIVQELRQQGLTVVFSSQLVDESMRVTREPDSKASPLTRLQEILQPYALTTQTLPGGSTAIIRKSDNSASPSTPIAKSTPATLDELIVQASRYSLDREPLAPTYSLIPEQLQSAPGVDEDALRTLQHLPGTATNGLSARAHIRGGYEDELLVRYDGMRLYDPYHLKDFLGLFSVLDPELVQSIDYFSGGFPVSFGGRSAAVMDIEPRHADKPLSLVVGESVLNSRFIGSGTFDADRGSWLVGLRRSNLNDVLRLLDRDVGEPEFEDATFRGSYSLTDDTLIKAGWLRLNDRLDLFTRDRSQQADAAYTDNYGWFALDTQWAPRLSSHLQFSTAALATRRSGQLQQPGIVSGFLSDRRTASINTLAMDWLFAGDTLRWRWGAQSDYGRARYDYISAATYIDPLRTLFALPAQRQQQFAYRPSGWSHAVYASAEVNAGALAVESGLRWDRANYAPGPGLVSPRLSARYQLDAQSVLKFTAGRYTQTQSINEAQIEDVVPHFEVPESTRQLILSFERQLPLNLLLRIEAYDKAMSHVRPRQENLVDPLVLLPEIEPDRVTVSPDHSNAHGLELTLGTRTHSTLDWWLTYSIATVTDTFADGEQRARSWDQRHAVNGGIIWTVSRWTHSAALTWHSGWPYTTLPSVQSGVTATELATRNNERFDTYVSLDLRTQYSRPLRWGSMEVALEVRNIGNRANQCCREFIDDADALNNGQVDTRRIDSFGILPIISVEWRYP
jgi:hypothetical protein